MINIGSIKNISRAKKCSRGTIISGDGVGNIMFIILKGEVGVYTNYRSTNAEMISTLGSGDIFADAGLLEDKKAAYTTVALSEAIIVPIEKRSFNAFLQDEPTLTFELIKDLYLRLERANTTCKELIVHHAAGQRHKEKKPETTKPVDVKPEGDKQPPLTAEYKPTAAAVSELSTSAIPVGSHKNIIEKNEFKLFPEEHGAYELVLNNNDTTLLMNKSHTCPVCKGNFNTLSVKSSKLVHASTDSDMRSRYKGIEPLYYDVLTCPNCLYSALQDMFEIPDKSKAEIMRALEAVKNTVTIHQGTEKDTASVFAGFYLALFCAPISFSKYQLVAAKLLYKLSRVYQDAGDENMANLTAQKALDNYLYVYEKIGISSTQEQQVCILIGELYLKQDDLRNALVFFGKAKASGNSTPVMKNHAENRIYDIREMAALKR